MFCKGLLKLMKLPQYLALLQTEYFEVSLAFSKMDTYWTGPDCLS